MRLGWPEILLILGIVLIVFGAGKLPQVGTSLGKTIRAFRKAQSGDDEEDTSTVKTVKAPEKTSQKDA